MNANLYAGNRTTLDVAKMVQIWLFTRILEILVKKPDLNHFYEITGYPRDFRAASWTGGE